jgi:hypothetical protein
MDWIRKNEYGLIDVQVLPSYLSDLALDGMVSTFPSLAKILKELPNRTFVFLIQMILLQIVGRQAKKTEQAKTVKRMVNWIWNQFISSVQCPEGMLNRRQKFALGVLMFGSLSCQIVRLSKSHTYLFGRRLCCASCAA